MNWKPRLYWAALSASVVIVAWLLTRWVTHVNHGADVIIHLTLDQRPAPHINLRLLTLEKAQRERFLVPRIVVVARSKVLFVIPRDMQAVTIAGISPREIACRSNARALTRPSLTELIAASDAGDAYPLQLLAAGNGTRLVVPRAIRAALLGVHDGQAAIVCSVVRPLAAAPTFTDRSLTLDARNGSAAVLLDISALEDLDNLRFSGGITLPLFGERTRLLDATNNVVSVEWSDVAAEEQRDIVLVLIGGLAAIAAATAIEAIRPFIEAKGG